MNKGIFVGMALTAASVMAAYSADSTNGGAHSDRRVTVQLKDWMGKSIGTVNGVALGSSFAFDAKDYFNGTVDYVTAFDGGSVAKASSDTYASGSKVTWSGIGDGLETEIFVQPRVPYPSAHYGMADPWIVKDPNKNTWYSIYTNGKSFRYRSNTSFPTASWSKTETTFYTFYDHTDEVGDYLYKCWAPEMHYIRGNWYIYTCMSTTNENDDWQRIHCFKLDGSNVVSSLNWHLAKRIVTPGTTDSNLLAWGIDATVLDDTDASGRMWLIWSGWPSKNNQNLYMAELASPTSFVANASRVLLSSPTKSWERLNRNVNEGPVVLRHGNATHVVYSCNGCASDYYSLALLTCTNGNYGAASSWKKHDGRIFVTRKTAYGPGHCSFTKDAAGHEYVVYHAKYESGHEDAYWSYRDMRVQPIAWHGDFPVLGAPRPFEGTTDGFDANADYTKSDAETRTLVHCPSTLIETVPYTGTEQSPSWANCECVTIVSGGSRTVPGTNTVTLALSDTTRYVWSDGTTANKTAKFAVVHDHVWGEWTTNVVAKCETKGIATRVCLSDKCSNPPAVQTNELAALEHVWGDWVTTREPEIGVPGEKYRECQRSGCDGVDIQPIDPQPEPGSIYTNAMATAAWGYEIHGLGEASNEVALVFTNTAETMSFDLSGVSSIRYLLVGGGGAGGSVSSDYNYSGYGGAGGAVVEDTTALSSSRLVIDVGVGGVKSESSYAAGGAGGASTLTVNGSTEFTASGGAGGAGGKSHTNAGTGGAGAGGPGSACDGSKGGAGGPGKAITIIDDMRLYGAGGGGGATGTSSAAGGAGGTTGGGKGGKGVAGSSSGGAGTFYGAGGGGSAGVGSTKGGNGYQGIVIIRYVESGAPVPPAPMSVSPANYATAPNLHTAFAQAYDALSWADKKAKVNQDGETSAWRIQAKADYRTNNVPVRLSWSGTSGSCAVTVTEAKSGRQLLSTTVSGTSVNVYDVQVGRNYQWTLKNGTSTVTNFFYAPRTLPRIINRTDVSAQGNCRDLGGYVTANGKVVRQGMIYRNDHVVYNAFTKLKDDAGNVTNIVRKAQLYDYWNNVVGLKTEIDLRDPLYYRAENEEFRYTGSPFGPDVTFWNAQEESGYAWGYYTDAITQSACKNALKATFLKFCDANNYPIDFHCSQGRDRTGTLAFFLLGTLGVSLNDIYVDYTYTDFCDSDDAYDGSIENLYNKLVSTYPTETYPTLQDKCVAHLKALGVKAEQISTFQSIMLEDEEKPLGSESHEHVWSDWTTNVAATCLTDGLATRTCTAEGCSEPPVAETNVLSALDHDWSAWVTDVEPQIGVPGHKYRDCTRCTAHEEEEISPLPPAPTEVTTNAMATAAWGYEIHGLGEAMNEVALVFTNAADTTMNWTLPGDVTSIRYLVVAGGGGGGGATTGTKTAGGGGGAGGLLTGTVNVSGGDTLTVKVGKGGTAGVASANTATATGAAGKGGDSTLTVGATTIAQAVGGGAGAKYNNATVKVGGDGGSGGGGSYNTTAGGAGTNGQGNKGGFGGSSSHGFGGGGGGAGGAGLPTDTSTASTGYHGGAGGVGLSSDITGVERYYAGGGGGGAANNGSSGAAGTGGAGGLGGGGAGGNASGTATAGAKGVDGLGGGGGGGGRNASNNGGRGGSGVVVIRYATSGAGHLHEWSEWTTNVAATCEAPGEIVRVCTAEGCTEPPAAQTNAVAALGHDWGEWIVDQEAQPGVPGQRHRVCARCEAEESEPFTVRPLRILTIGNSFSVKMIAANALPRAAALVGCPIDYAHFYKAGATLSQAWSNRNSADAYEMSTRFTSAENPLESLEAKTIANALKAVDWDIVTLQQGSASSYKSDTYAPYFQNLVNLIRESAPNAKIVWHMTWSYDRYSAKLSGWDFKGDVAQRDKMFDRIVAAYEDNVAATAWKTIPTGYAIQLYRYGLPVTNPTDDFTNTDHQHLSVPGATDANPAGSYMQVLVWCQKLFGKMPSAAEYPPSAYSSSLANEDVHADLLRSCALAACEATSYRDYGQGTVDFSWNVTFKDDDGSVLASQSVTNGATATPPAPTREGWRVRDWTCKWPVVATSGVGSETVTATSDEVAAKKVYDNLVWTARWTPDVGELTTNAMANASWGYEVRGLGAAADEVALVFTNTAETMNWTLPEGVTSVRYLVAGGGASGGASSGNAYYTSGGGGAGGLREAEDVAVTSRDFAVTVGAGGAAVSASGASAGTSGVNGGDSTLKFGDEPEIVAYGGGGGSKTATPGGADGGSGGGAGTAWTGPNSSNYNFPFGTGVVGQGTDGGTAKRQAGAGGGGGAAGKGESTSSGSTVLKTAGGAGGAGKMSLILGVESWYCAGGGGGGYTGAGGAGGEGGGGAGSKQAAGKDTVAGGGRNYGCGGGGTCGLPAADTTQTHTSGAGYQGVVIVRYRMSATPTGKWDEVESSQVDGVTDSNKVAVETTLDAIQASLPEGATAAKVGEWLTTVYGNQKVSAATLANAKQVGISVKYDLPLLVSETPTVTVEVSSDPVSDTGVAAFVFTIKDGDTPVSVAQAKVQEMVQYAATLAGGFAPSTSAEVEVTPDGTSFKAELKRVDGRNSGFMKVELK